MKRFSKYKLNLTVITACILLAACGGGGGGGSSASSGGTLTGTVAVGAPIAGASIFATGANGVVSNTVTADANGQYTGLNLSGLTAPIVIEANGEFGQTPYKLHTVLDSNASANANVTPITSLIASVAAGKAAEEISASGLNSSTLASAIQTAKTALATALTPVTQALSLDLSTNDPVSKVFTTNNTGLDKLLDAVEIKITPSDGITLTNRFEKIAETAGSSERTSVALSFTGQATGTLPNSTSRDLSWISTLAQSFTDCFALPAAQRIVYTLDPGGVPVASSVHNTCKSFVNNSYVHNGYTFGDRWAFVLRDTAFDNATFKINLVYVVDMSGTDAYVINVNFKDKDGNGYTRPEVVVQSAGSYQLKGNQRAVDAYVEPVIANLSDYTSQTSALNRIEGRLRLVLTPHRDSDGASGYKFFYDSANKPDPIWACSWVTGPGLPGEGAQNTAQNGPVGGVLLKVPRSDFTQKREYMAIAYKFPETFDPVSNQSDRNQLAKACGTREWVSNPPAPANGGRWEVATFSIYSNFTIDFAKIDSSSTFTWPTASDGNINFNWAGSSNSFPANNAGLKYGSSALNPVAPSVKVAYKPTSMPIYNFYSFRFSDLQTLGNIWTGPNAAIAIVDDNIGNTFWSKKIITKSRMIGEMPYLKRDSNDLYTGNTKFGTIGSSTLTNYLGSSAPAIAIGDTLPASWTSAIGGTGIDRLGFTCFGTWMSGSNKFRWGPSFSSGSWVFPRNITSRTFIFDDTCLGYGDVNSAPNGFPANTTIKTVYRDIWVRSYNQNNTQIQRVYIAER